MEQSSEAQTSKAGLAEAQARADEVARQEASKQGHSAKGKSRILGENGIALGTTKADLCVVATKPFKAGDLVLLCKGGVKDLTKSEDEALREEAAVDRERQKEAEYNGVLGQGRDFSVIRSARKGCSQLLLGPARFVNHDCDPNCEFHRLGPSQMVFKCLRNIGLNEEITTYYGDNYFEWENSECMCRTCEDRGKGFFSSKEPEEQMVSDGKEHLTITEANKQRRTSQRKVVNPSPPPARASVGPTTTTFERNGKTTTKTFHHHVSQREFDEDSATHRGPKCTCLTCGTMFWAPEAWWMPDECRRCERHYRIFKADWPGRLPTEGGWSARAKVKRKELEIKDTETKKRKLLHAPSPGISSSNSDTDTPVKLSPLRDTEADEEPVKSSKVKKKRRILQTDDGTDEDAIDASLRRASPRAGLLALETGGKRKAAAERNEEESDLTSVSDEGDADSFALPLMTRRSTPSSAADSDRSSTSSRPSGPKMLGKEAKTETLALYWGAPSGDRRKSRQSQTGLEVLAKTVRKEGPRSVSLRKEHRRNISDMSTASAPSKTSVQHRLPSGIEDHLPQRRDSLPDFEVPPDAIAEDTIWQTSSIPLPKAVESSPQPLLDDISPMRGMPNLATKGAARTSVKNLAMAWSAGVDEGGRGSRRRQPRDVSQSMATTITAPTVKRKSVSKDDFIEPEASQSDVDSIKREASISAPPPLVGPSVMDLPDDRSASPAVSMVETHPRPASPLVASPAVAFTNRPGVIPGKPIRKNLRWGSGKVSNSRPFIGSAASFTGAAPSAAGYTSHSEGYIPNLSSPGTSHTPSQGPAWNGHEEFIAKSETPSPIVLKERTSSPLVRAALHTSSLASSTQLQNVASNGHSSNGNGTPYVVKQHTASPIHHMGPPRMLQQEAVSPGTQVMFPKLESESDQLNGQMQQGPRHNGNNDLHMYTMQSQETPPQ